MSKKSEQKQGNSLFDLDDALMQMFPENGDFKKNKTIFSMDEIMQKVFPSAFIREYWKKVKFKPKTKDIALIIINNNSFSLYLKLLLMKSLAEFADNKESKEYVQQYLEAQVNQLNMFAKKEEGTLFELQVSHGEDWFSLALMENLDGLVWLGNLWKNSPCHKNDKVRFMIVKRLIYDHPVFMPKEDIKEKDTKTKAKSKKDQEYPYLPENKGCITLTDDFYIRSVEYGYSTGIDFESWTIGSFSVPEDDYYNICFPMPFKKGDMVHNVVTDSCGVVAKVSSKKKDTGYYLKDVSVYDLGTDGTMSCVNTDIFNIEIFKDNQYKWYNLLKMFAEHIMGKKINIPEMVRLLDYYFKKSQNL